MQTMGKTIMIFAKKMYGRDSFCLDFTFQRFLLNLAKNSGFTEKKIETKLDSFIGFLHPIALT